jgi:CelD/BcsL family acetyltransferase involved in cellulose biosynthesis
VSVVTLEIGQELAAANIMIGCRDRIVGHVFTYDSKFAKDSVGAHVVHHTIKQAIADGYKTFDLLSPADEYKMRSADGTVGVVNWAIPLSPKGRAFVHIVLRTARPLAKALIERLPSRLRTALAQRYYRKTS